MRRLRWAAPPVLLLLLLLLLFTQTNLRHAIAPDAESNRVGSEDPATGTSGAARTLPAGDKTSTMARGVVRDEASKAHIPGAAVVLRDRHSRAGGTVIAVTTADSLGAFELPCRQDAFIEARARGYAPRQISLVCADGAFVDLHPGVIVSGRVVQSGNRGPASGALVTCHDAEFLPSSDTAESDASGAFVLGSCPASTLIVGATHVSGAPARKNLGARAGGDIVSDVILELGVGRRLAGRVVDAGGSPVADADVVVLENDEWEGAQLLRSQSDGSFETGISRQMHIVGAVTDDGRAARATVAFGTEDPKSVELRLPTWFTMPGRLVGDSTDATVTLRRNREGLTATEPANIRERLPYLQGGGGVWRSAPVTGDRFTFDGVEPGSYHLEATSPTAQGKVTANHDDPDIVIVMKPAARLLISISYGGKPADGTVQLEWADGAIVSGTEDGVFDSSFGMPTGDYWVTYHPDEGPAPAVTHFVAKAGENTPSVTLSDSTVRVEGRVIDGSDAPIAGVKVSVPAMSGMNPGTPFGYEHGLFVLTETDGRFAIDVAAISDPLFFVKHGFESRLIPAAEAGVVRLSPGASEPRPPRPKPAPKRPAADASRT